ncbi:MAG: DNA/RNA nuclease SfsA [Gemmatimonadales bacterium]|nr:MAG: DNA/RNA nuclease SfsA [Gemmatimonadales bacterium]
MARIPFAGDLVAGRFVHRPNRFLVEARIPGSTEPVKAHLPDPGRLRELLVPGAPVWLEPARDRPGAPPRKTRWTLRLVESVDGSRLVSLDTTLPNRLVEAALRARALPEFEGWELVRPEVTRGRSRFDFLLAEASGGAVGGSASRAGVEPRGGAEERPRRELLLEVKSVTLVEDRVALFPDAVTARGRRHVEELAELARGGTDAGAGAQARAGAHASADSGTRAAVLFVAQRDDVEEIRAARSIDPAFADALADARAAGVSLLGRRCRVDAAGVSLLGPVPVSVG